MKRNVSRHEILVFRTLAAGQWITSKEIAERSGVAPRTARAHVLKLVRLGIVDQAEVFPGHRYRISEHAERRRGYYDRIRNAAEALGIEL